MRSEKKRARPSVSIQPTTPLPPASASAMPRARKRAVRVLPHCEGPNSWMIRCAPARVASVISKIGPSLPGKSSVPRAIALHLHQRQRGLLGLALGVGLADHGAILDHDAGLARVVGDLDPALEIMLLGQLGQHLPAVLVEQ